MAIVFDAVSAKEQVSSTSSTMAFTIGAVSNPVLVVFFRIYGTTDLVTGVTYNGVAMTRLQIATEAGQRFYTYYLGGAATGNHNIVITVSSTIAIGPVQAISYSGAAVIADGYTAKNQADASSITLTETVTAGNSWQVCFTTNDNNENSTPGAGTTERIDPGAGIYGGPINDSNGPLAPGSRSLIVNNTYSRFGMIVSIAPFVAPPVVGKMFLMF